LFFFCPNQIMTKPASAGTPYDANPGGFSHFFN